MDESSRSTLVQCIFYHQSNIAHKPLILEVVEMDGPNFSAAVRLVDTFKKLLCRKGNIFNPLCVKLLIYTSEENGEFNKQLR